MNNHLIILLLRVVRCRSHSSFCRREAAEWIIIMSEKRKIKSPVKGKVAKVPVVMQMEALECGAACLDMILAYYGLWLPLEKVRLDCGVSRDGSNAANIYRAGVSYGLEASAYRLELADVRDASFPCIIHWDFNHFVVLCGFKGDKAVLCDPGRGRVEVDMEEFDRSFTGVCLSFKPGESFKPGGKRKSILGFAKKRLKGTAPIIVFVILTSLITSVLNVISPVMSRVFMDYLLSGAYDSWLYPFTILMAVLALIKIIVTVFSTVYNLKLEGKLDAVASSGYMWHVLRLPMEFFSQRSSGDLAMRKSLNQSIASSIINTAAPLLLDFAQLIVYLLVMLRYSVLLTAVGVASILINLGTAAIISEKRINISRAMMRDAANMANTAASGMDMIETLKASGAENGFFAKWAGYQALVQKGECEGVRLNMFLGSVPELVSSLANIAILMLGTYLAVSGQFTAGMILAFQGFMTSFSAPAQSLISAGQSMTEMRTDMERIEDVMEYPADVDYSDALPPEDVVLSKLGGKIELKNVTFGYSRLAAPLIENFSMTLEPGRSVAFVGPSGCGKSTLSKLISGLYKPWSGEILFDGKPISDISREVFTGSLSVVDQSIVLFEDTIRNNIKMWDNSIEDFEMILAARDAQIHDDIVSREGGYDGMLSNNGQDLSGGQRQRMEIARVLAQDPTIIILDEATSALDAATEYGVISAIKNRGISSVVVAHRLSTIRDCDEIIVLNKGKVEERGTHDQLIASGGLYTQLVTNE